MESSNKYGVNVSSLIREDAGYGNDYFVDEKIEKSQHYFFKIDNAENEVGLILKVGKFSKSSVISDSEKSYGVIHLEQLDPNDMDDYLVNDSEYKSTEDDIFNLPEDVLSQAFFIVTKALENYLQKNPKVTKFYDEILENLDMSPEDYLEFISPKIKVWSKGRWKIQDGPSNKVFVYTKVSHE